MGEIVNLRRVKRQAAREAAAQAAAENRVRHGRTGAQKAADALTEKQREAAAKGRLLVSAPPNADDGE